jgi:hypothetical protein
MKCYKYNTLYKRKCEKNNCRYWIAKKDSMNCCLIASKENKKLTLEDVGKFFNVTRMRICQIEKNALRKIKERLSKII